MPRLPCRLIAACLAAALVLVGCGGRIGRTPAPTPMDFEGIVGLLGGAGIGVANVVSGDPGCDDPTLAGPAVSAELSGLDQPTPVRVRVYIFRNQSAYERRRADVDDCLQSFIVDPARIEALDAAPFVVAGEGPWGTEFRQTLREVLRTASDPAGASPPEPGSASPASRRGSA